MTEKRVLDLLCAALGVAVLSPLFAVISLAVLLVDGRPVLFRQIRVGRGGRSFQILKFRTMRSDTRGSAPSVTARGDKRVTALGRWLRAYKLDELPQLLNVLSGDMSLVGPRPEVPKYVSLYPEEAREIILAVRPGITDPMTSAFYREEELLASASDPEHYYVEHILPIKISGYVQYVQQQSLAGDVSIVLKTIGQVLGLLPRASTTKTAG